MIPEVVQRLYLPTEKHLHILAAGKKIKFLSQVDLGTRSWATPRAANGMLYIVARNCLWALKRDTSFSQEDTHQ